jgi:hypothetical protein
VQGGRGPNLGGTPIKAIAVNGGIGRSAPPPLAWVPPSGRLLHCTQKLGYGPEFRHCGMTIVV